MAHMIPGSQTSVQRNRTQLSVKMPVGRHDTKNLGTKRDMIIVKTRSRARNKMAKKSRRKNRG